MTFREKLAREHPGAICEGAEGGCYGCPADYRYEEGLNCPVSANFDCSKCWDREMPEQK